MRAFARWGRIVTVSAALAALAVPAWAADDDEASKPFREPGINYMEYQKPYIPWLIGAGMIIVCLAIAFKNPHRSHLD